MVQFQFDGVDPRREEGRRRGVTYGFLGDDGELPGLHALLGELPRRVPLSKTTIVTVS
jgi:hypothetical protein